MVQLQKSHRLEPEEADITSPINGDEVMKQVTLHMNDLKVKLPIDEDVNDSDSESAPSENIPKVALTRRLTRDIKNIRNKNATKRNLLSKISSKRSNLTCKTLHNFAKTCRESTNLVGKFVLPTQCAFFQGDKTQ
nr:unnamed protein product [Callosobruchus chinensis]